MEVKENIKRERGRNGPNAQGEDPADDPQVRRLDKGRDVAEVLKGVGLLSAFTWG